MSANLTEIRLKSSITLPLCAATFFIKHTKILLTGQGTNIMLQRNKDDDEETVKNPSTLRDRVISTPKDL